MGEPVWTAAEAGVDPETIDWPKRQEAALIWFDVVNRRPRNPSAPTGRGGGLGEMGYWAETKMVDALVIAIWEGEPHLLMVERRDGLGWAVPGGGQERGETRRRATTRELEEETGLDLSSQPEPEMLRPRVVDDPRSTDEAWPVTQPAVFRLGKVRDLPAAAGKSDAARAAWVPARNCKMLTAGLQRRFNGTVFPAHIEMLRELLG